MRVETDFDVYFPASWSGVRTGIWCGRRRIGKHIMWVLSGTDEFFRITVLTVGERFRPIAGEEVSNR